MLQNDDDFVLFAQESSLPQELANFLKEWVVQRQEGKKPSALTQEEINHLSFLSVSCLRQRALGEKNTGSWSPLLPLLENWVVQRRKGELPTKITVQDCQDLVRLVLKALITPIYIEQKSENALLENKEVEDPLFFLREHLSQGL
ncbi:hypothetical protein FAI41_06395 [Acetobacteraceae bacterium]|nr:hypothetical protein FAI41_06395 [Acetobacteraceae bacterium]